MRFVVFGCFALSFLFLGPKFAFGALIPPTPVSPTQQDSPVWKGKVEFRWTGTGAPYYKYFIDLPSGEGKTGIISSTVQAIHGLEVGVYRWRVSSCNDREGVDCGSWSDSEQFEIVLAPKEYAGGLIPCGRSIDDPSTAFLDESEACGLPHIFVLLKNILDFVLWRLGLLVIAVMAVLTAFVSYFSFGGPEVLVKIKSTWRSVFVGYLLALFAWLLVNIVLNVFGFQVPIFGTWWQLTF